MKRFLQPVLIAGLQRRLLLLLLVALLPVFGFVVISSLQQRQNDLAHAGENVLRSSRLAALSVERTVEGTQQLLNAITSAPSLKDREFAALCPRFLANIGQNYHYYRNVGFLDLEGNLLCDALNSAPGTSFKDRFYFQQALQTRAFASGGYQVGRLTGQPSLNFGMPVYANDGALRGVAFAALDPRQLGLGLNMAQPQTSVVVTDRQGVILGAGQAASQLVGTPFPDAAFRSALQPGAGLTQEAEDPEGMRRIYAVTPVLAGAQPGLYVIASMPREAITGPSSRALVWQIGMLALLACMGILAARWVGEKTLVRPARRLLVDINELAPDDSQFHPTDLEKSRDEMVALNAAFHRVAHVLKVRNVERDRTQTELQKVGDRLITAQRIAKIGNWEFDVASKRVWWSAQAYAVIGQSPDTFHPSVRSLRDSVFPEDRERFELAQQAFLSGEGVLNIEHRITTADGQVRWIHGLGELQRDADGQPLLASGTVQDVSSQVRNERLLASEARALKALSLGLPVQSVLDDFLVGLEEILPGALAAVHLLSADGLRLVHGSAPHLPEAYTQALDGIPIGPNVGSCGTAAYRRQTVVVSDIQTDPLWTDYRALALEHGLRACWSIPLHEASGKVIATLGVYYREPREPHPEELAVVQGAASVISIAIERDRREAAFRASEQRFRNTFLEAATGMAITTLKGRFLEVNTAYCAMLGYTAEEMYGLSIEAVTYPEDWPQSKSQYKDLATGKRGSVVTEKRYVTRTGDLKWVRISASLLRDAGGQPQGFIRIAEDIHERRMAMEQLQQTQKLLSMASRISRQGAWQIDIPGYGLTWSEEVRDIHALAAGAAPNLDEALGFYLPEHQAVMRQLLADCESRGTPFDAELQILTAQARKVWVRVVGEAVRDETGEIIRVQGALQDINQQKQTEAREHAAAQQLATTLQSMSDGFMLLGPDWRFVFLNDHAEMLFQRRHAELLGFNLWKAFPELMGTVFEKEYRGAVATGQASRFEAFYEPLQQWLEVNVYPTEEGLAVYLQDVTGKRTAAEQLRLLETAVSRLSDMIVITEAEPLDAGPRIVFVNDAFERTTGFSREEVIGKSPAILQGPKTQRAELDRIRAALEAWKPVRAELINYTKDGREFWIELDIVPIADETGWYTHWVSVERDITERKAAQQEIVQLNAELEDRVQRRTVELEAAVKELEAFSYSVSHDLRSPLNTINGFGQLLQKSSAEKLDEKGRHYLNRMRAGAQQMGTLIDGLLSLARLAREPLRVTLVNLLAITQRIEQECRERDPARVVEVHIEDGLQAVGDATMLLVVMQNLFENAWKYTSKLPSAKIEVGSKTGNAGETIYFVRDNGAGFDMAYADKLFGTFQRLHSPSDFSGTGVGLANVKRVIDRHGGHVWAESSVNHGATFYFTLAPLAAAIPLSVEAQ